MLDMVYTLATEIHSRLSEARWVVVIIQDLELSQKKNLV